MKREPKAKDFPAHSFINAYMRHMEGLETSFVYDFWCALWLVSIACGRDVVVDRPRVPVYMNMYLCLCAESGVTRKSTAVNEATKLAKLWTKNYEVIESRMSTAKLETRLSDISERTGKAWTLISISEMVNFFGKARSSGLVGLLTDLYDCPSNRIGGGTNQNPLDTILKNVFISLVTASTPSWLMTEITPSIIEGGFTSRTLFVWSEVPKAEFPMPQDLDPILYLHLGHEMDRMHQAVKDIGGKIAINTKAQSYFERWYRNRHHYRDSFRASFGGREDAHILRVAGLLCIADRTYQIQLQHIKAAISNVIQVRDEATKLFEGLGSRTGLVIAIDRIRDALVGAGKEVVTGTDLSRKTQAFIRKDQLHSILDIMNELSMIQKFEIKSKSAGGRPLTVYRGTKAVIRKGAVDEVLMQMP